MVLIAPHFTPENKLIELTSPKISQETIGLLKQNLDEIEMCIYVYLDFRHRMSYNPCHNKPTSRRVRKFG